MILKNPILAPEPELLITTSAPSTLLILAGQLLPSVSVYRSVVLTALLEML